MFDFLKRKAPEPPKDPLLFKMRVMLNPSNDNVLMEGCQLMTLMRDGTAYAGRKVAGRIPSNTWKYITGFCTPDHMQRTGFNSFEIEIRGTADIPSAYHTPEDSQYVYRCGHVEKYPHLLPDTEYLCDLVRNGDHLDIMVNNEKIGEMDNARDRCDRLEKMLSDGFQATAQIEPAPEHCRIFLIVRKV